MTAGSAADAQQTVLVGYLATDGGADAVALGARFARSTGAPLELLMVLPPQDVARRAPALDYGNVLTDQAGDWLREARAQVGPGVECRTHIVHDESTAGGILARAGELGAAVVVVGSSGGGLIGHHSLGTVVNELLHSSSVPVALAPRGLRHTDVTRVREVTAAVGLKAGADRLIETAGRAADAARVPLRLLSLVAFDAWGGRVRRDENIHADARRHAESVVAEVREQNPSLAEVTWEVVDGPSVEAAVNQVDWHDGDALLVGSSRLAAPRRLFLGSTAAKMLRTVRVPVVIVPAAGEETEGRQPAGSADEQSGGAR